MILKIEIEREMVEGSLRAAELPGVLAYGATEEEARGKVQAIASRVLADRLYHGEGLV